LTILVVSGAGIVVLAPGIIAQERRYGYGCLPGRVPGPVSILSPNRFPERYRT